MMAAAIGRPRVPMPPMTFRASTTRAGRSEAPDGDVGVDAGGGARREPGDQHGRRRDDDGEHESGQVERAGAAAAGSRPPRSRGCGRATLLAGLAARGRLHGGRRTGVVGARIGRDGIAHGVIVSDAAVDMVGPGWYPCAHALGSGRATGAAGAPPVLDDQQRGSSSIGTGRSSCWPARAPARPRRSSRPSAPGCSIRSIRSPTTRVLALTFGRKAATELRDRVTARLGGGVVPDGVDLPLLRLRPAAAHRHAPRSTSTRRG